MSDDRLRIDKWLWVARFYKSRSLAAAMVEQGLVTVNGAVVRKAAHCLKPGDELIFPVGGIGGRRRRRAVRVLGVAGRRGPASESQALYAELPAPVLDAEDW